jgi:hypothetical protein
MMEKIGVGTIVSLLVLIGGIVFYLGWGFYYGVWADIGSYSFTIIMVLGGLFGLLLTVFKKKDEE